MESLAEERFRRVSGRRGFTLIELLIVMVILAILAGVVVMSVGGIFTQADETAYNAMRHQIQNAVVEYMGNSTNVGSVPLLGINVTIDGEVRDVIDICDMKTPLGIIREAPRGCIEIPGPDNDNCDNGSCLCDATYHYLWAVDDSGNLFSACVDTAANGGGCVNNSSDGFQGVWP